MATKRYCIAVIAACIAVTVMDIPAGARGLPSCARPERSVLEFPGGRGNFDIFARKLKESSADADSCVTIWHFGDSHVQAGYLSSRLRERFGAIGAAPASDRGYVFPYPAAHSNYDKSYYAACEGEWTGSRSSNPDRTIPVRPDFGITGIAAYTADTLSSFTVKLPYPFVRLRLFAQLSEAAPCAVSPSGEFTFLRDSIGGGYLAEFPSETDSVRIEPRISPGGYFMITGLLPEPSVRRGVRVVSTGVNGASCRTWISRCPQFASQAREVKPDLIIAGLGINDSACPQKSFNAAQFKADYRKVLDIMLKDTPSAALVFMVPNDSWRYVRRGMTRNVNIPSVRRAIKELAAEYHAAVWDLYTIMGGKMSAVSWRDGGLMMRDRLHFTPEGYATIGDMLFEAIMAGCGNDSVSK